jgi:rRNA maturation protein Nop10
MPDAEPAFITLPDSPDKHVVGDDDCDAGWCDQKRGYPMPCPECGEGLVHAEFGDEDSDGNYWLHTKCDRCGETGL